jgi:uncharacterized protein (DUF1778 family)
MAALHVDSGTKTETIQVRVTPEVKDMLEHAADLRNISLSNLLLNSAYDIATRTIVSHNIIDLSRRDSEIFATALLNPPESNEALKKASVRYAEMVKR